MRTRPEPPRCSAAQEVPPFRVNPERAASPPAGLREDNMRKVIIALGLAAALLSGSQAAKADAYFHRPVYHAPAFHIGVDVWRRGAWHHGWYGGRFGWWWVAG